MLRSGGCAKGRHCRSAKPRRPSPPETRLDRGIAQVLPGRQLSGSLAAASRPCPRAFRSSCILPLAVVNKDGSCDATGHSAKTSKEPRDSLDAMGILVNGVDNDFINRAEVERGLSFRCS